MRAGEAKLRVCARCVRFPRMWGDPEDLWHKTDQISIKQGSILNILHKNIEYPKLYFELNIQNCVLNIQDSGQIMRLQRSKWVLNHGQNLRITEF